MVPRHGRCGGSRRHPGTRQPTSRLFQHIPGMGGTPSFVETGVERNRSTHKVPRNRVNKILGFFQEPAVGGTTISGEGYLAPIQVLGDTFLLSPRSLHLMTPERNILYVLNKVDNDRFQRPRVGRAGAFTPQACLSDLRSPARRCDKGECHLGRS